MGYSAGTLVAYFVNNNNMDVLHWPRLSVESFSPSSAAFQPKGVHILSKKNIRSIVYGKCARHGSS